MSLQDLMKKIEELLSLYELRMMSRTEFVVKIISLIKNTL